MSIREIIRMGHPNLRIPAIDYPPGAIGSPEFDQLIDDMHETLIDAGGIGLAAPQIDVGYRIAIIEIENTTTRYGEIEASPFEVYINPVITTIQDELQGYWEGCLSVPGMMGYVERPQHIQVDYMNRHGIAQSIEAHDFLATVFQHEFDHLNGVLYVDRIEDKRLFAFEEEYVQFHTDASPERN